MEILWILLVPVIWLIVAKVWLHTTFNWAEFAVSLGIITILVVVTILGSKWGATSDTEIWNGQVTKKEMDDGWYQRSYDCNCTSYSCGTSKSPRTCERCQTCYEDHYTRSYDGFSTVGKWTFASIDTTSKMRRNSFGPTAEYTNCKIGEPASREHSYTNYVQAVPQSLFHDGSKLAEQYVDKIPAYPRVHGFYKIGRVLQVGVSHQQAGNINTMLSEALIKLGASKQVNIIVVLTNIQDKNYIRAIENAWLGGEKNDVVVVVGLDGDRITWSNTFTWALNDGNGNFHVKMRDGVEELGTLDPNTFVPLVTSTIESTYDRPEMAEYEYLESEIEVPTWAFILALVFAFGGSALLTFVFHHNELGGSRGFSRRNFYRRR